MKEAPAFDAFISYSSSDTRLVEALALSLRDAGQQVWFDRWELAPGQAWEDALTQAISKSSAALVCIGPSGLSLLKLAPRRAALLDNADTEVDVLVSLRAPDAPPGSPVRKPLNIKDGEEK